MSKKLVKSKINKGQKSIKLENSAIKNILNIYLVYFKVDKIRQDRLMRKKRQKIIYINM